MNNILKAIYLVKLDDARQIKNASLEHQKKISEIQFLKQNKIKSLRESLGQSQNKEKYMRYWKQKLNALYVEQNKQKMEIDQQADERKKQLKFLQDEEMLLLEEMNRIHEKKVESKKQYFAALSLPAKEIVDALNSSEHEKVANRSMIHNKSQSIRYKESPAKRQGNLSKQDNLLSILSTRDISIPNTQVDNSKFKIILKELKKLEKKQKSPHQILNQ